MNKIFVLGTDINISNRFIQKMFLPQFKKFIQISNEKVIPPDADVIYIIINGDDEWLRLYSSYSDKSKIKLVKEYK